MSSEVIHFFFELQLNLKMYHWMTGSYARHKASDQLLDELSGKVDQFVEVYIGRNGKPKVSGKKHVTYGALSDKDVVGYLKTQLSHVEKMDLSKYADLDNIRAEIVAAMNQALYLFALE